MSYGIYMDLYGSMLIYMDLKMSYGFTWVSYGIIWIYMDELWIYIDEIYMDELWIYLGLYG